MKAAFLLPTVQNGAKRILMGLVLAIAAMFPHHAAAADTATVPLGSDSGFAVLAGSAITVAGAVNSTMITGDIGTYPTTTYTGSENVVLTGSNRSLDTGVMVTAKDDLVTAYNNASRSYDFNYGGADYDLGSDVLTHGVYYGGSSFSLTGTLTLDAEGDPDAVWIFQAVSSLTTATGSSVVFEDGVGSPCNVFWRIGSSATLGSYSDFVGNILALTSITLDPYATVDGRVLAQNGAVELKGYNTITLEDCTANGGGDSMPDTGSTLLLLSSGLASLLAFRLNSRSKILTMICSK
jgi:hypothetical protein